LTVGFLSPDNGGTEGGVKTIEYFMYVRPVDYRLVVSSLTSYAFLFRTEVLSA